MVLCKRNLKASAAHTFDSFRKRKRWQFTKIVWIPLISIPGRRPWTQRTRQPRSSARMIAIAGAFTTQSRTVPHSFIPLCLPLLLVRRSELMQPSLFSSPALTYTFPRDWPHHCTSSQLLALAETNFHQVKNFDLLHGSPTHLLSQSQSEKLWSVNPPGSIY